MPDFRLAPLSAVPSTTDTMIVGDDGPQTVSLPATAGPDLTERAQRIELTRVAAAATGSMLLDDTQLETWQAELDTLLSTGLTDDEADVELDRISAETIERPRPGRGALPPFTFTLTGRSSPLRWNLRNNGDEPLQRRRAGQFAEADVPRGRPACPPRTGHGDRGRHPGRGSNARHVGHRDRGAHARRSSSRSIEPVVLTARVNALTGLGQVVTGGAILVLGSWWFAHFRRSRRRRMEAIAALEQGDELGEVSPDAAEVVAVPDQQQTAQH